MACIVYMENDFMACSCLVILFPWNLTLLTIVLFLCVIIIRHNSSPNSSPKQRMRTEGVVEMEPCHWVSYFLLLQAMIMSQYCSVMMIVIVWPWGRSLMCLKRRNPQEQSVPWPSSVLWINRHRVLMIVLLMRVLRPLTRMPSRENIFFLLFLVIMIILLPPLHSLQTKLCLIAWS